LKLSIKMSKNIKKDIVFRLGLIFTLTLIASIAIIIRTLYLQYFKNEELAEKTKHLKYKEQASVNNRGDIYDCNGKFLAVSEPVFEARLDLTVDGLTDKVFKDNINELSDSLSKFPAFHTKNEYIAILDTARKRRHRFVLIAKDLTLKQKERLKTYPLFKLHKYKGGFWCISKDKRIKPNGILASRTIGYVKGNKVGIERSFDNELSSDQEILFKNYSGQWVPALSDENYAPIRGDDVVTALDINIQDFAHHALLEQCKKYAADTGIVVLMEVETGEIKANVNLVKNKKGNYVEAYNLAVGVPINPGSTFKLPVIMAAFEDNHINLNELVKTGSSGQTFFYGIPITEAHPVGYGTITVKQIFEKSSNVGMSLIIQKYYKGKERSFVRRLYSMNLNDKLGLQINGERPPIIRHPDDKGSWSGVSLPFLSIGYEVELTALQLLAFYNAVANNGKMIEPIFVKALLQSGKVIKRYKAREINSSICSKSTLKKAKILLEGVVKNGTARNIYDTRYKIAGKTGTAQVPEGKSGYRSNDNEVRSHYGSFVGYFPADKPIYSCIVILKTQSKSNYYGNIAAAPVFKKISDKLYVTSKKWKNKIENKKKKVVLSNVPYTKDGNRIDIDYVFNYLKTPVKVRGKISSAWVITKTHNNFVEYQNRKIYLNKVPKVIGMGLKDALYILETLGLNVVVKGKGAVKEQSINPGSIVKKNQRILIKLG